MRLEDTRFMTTRRVLIIEDNPDAADALAMLLRAAGHDVTTALSGEDGLERARHQSPDLVICDIRLTGGTDGLSVARRLRSDPATARTMLIALSGLSGPEERAGALAAGFDEFILKPADPDKILHIVSSSAPSA